MINGPGITEDIFSNIDHLHLLQLTTLRVMAENRSRRQQSETNEGTPSFGPEKTPDKPVVSSRWRLLPENVSLYKWQKDCLPLWLKEGRGTVKVATGGGKTLFALAAAQALQNEKEPDLRVVIVVPTIPLMFQWYDELRQGNIPPSAIGLMGGGQTLAPLSEIRILICVLNSARTHLPNLVAHADWSRRMLLIVDECHRAAATQASKIFDTKPRYTLGLSATPEPGLETSDLPTDEAYEKGIVGQSLGPIIFDFTLKESLEAGLLTPFEVWHIGLPLSQTESIEHARLSREISELRKTLQIQHNKSRSKQGFLAWCQSQAKRGGSAAAEAERFIGLASQRKRLLYHAQARIDSTLNILSESIIEEGTHAIVFHESIAEIENIFLKALDRQIPAVLEHSQLPESLRAENIEMFREGVAQVIISAKSLVEGFNVPSADLGIIAASSSSVRQRIQSLGRMLRRKPGGRTARVIVLYIRETEDEAIYEKADWENVIGAERNRYFIWHMPDQGKNWSDGLEEIFQPPRIFRPSSWDVDISVLSTGDLYPGQVFGNEVRIDQDNNLRSTDGSLIPVPQALLDKILIYNIHRRAVITPAGHVIVRSDYGKPGEPEWLFVGMFDPKLTIPKSTAIRLKIRTVSGRKTIARDDEKSKGFIPFARGPETSHNLESGQARDCLLEWIRCEEAKLKKQIQYLYWDGKTKYWLEIGGNLIVYEGDLPPLEFGE